MKDEYEFQKNSYTTGGGGEVFSWQQFTHQKHF